MCLKRKPKKEELCTLGQSHFVLIADYKYYLVHCWTCICNAFSCARFVFTVDHPPFLPAENCLEDLSFKEHCHRGITDPSIIYPSCFLFLLSDSFSRCSFATYFLCIFMQKLSRPLELWSEVKRVSSSKARWDSKIVENTNHFWVTSIMSFQPFRILLSILINSW